MKVIGVTGGVGSGKTEVLSYIGEHYKCRIIRADEAAHLLYEPGQECHGNIVGLLGKNILNGDGTIDRAKMAEIIFGDKSLLEKVNRIVHPAVKEYILGQIAYERKKGTADYFFIEAALLIEEHYDKIADELWYIHADAEIRRERLAESRRYSARKTADIMKGQLDEEEFRKHCHVIISNNGCLEETCRQIDDLLGIN